MIRHRRDYEGRHRPETVRKRVAPAPTRHRRSRPDWDQPTELLGPVLTAGQHCYFPGGDR